MRTGSSANPHKIVVFDFDGTITTRDTFALFLRYYAGTLRWALNILLLLPVFCAYGVRLVDRNAVKAHVIRRFFKGAAENDVNERARRFAQDVIPSLIRPGAQKALDLAKKRPETLYICSASIGPYLREWGRSQNIHNILATELATSNGVCTGEIEGWNVWGDGKVRRIEAEFAPDSVEIVEAYGDSRGDRELLHAAHVSYWQPFRVYEHHD